MHQAHFPSLRRSNDSTHAHRSTNGPSTSTAQHSILPRPDVLHSHLFCSPLNQKKIITQKMTATDPTLPHPRILCLHGGGVNATIFRLQCRTLLTLLSPTFRLVFANAPYPCPPHAAITSVYGASHGPCYRWLRYEDHHEAVTAQEASRAVLQVCRDAMDADDDAGATGEWVGVLGFSQGAKIAASLLWLAGWLDPRPLPRPMGMDVRLRFGVFMAGSAPVALLDPKGELEGERPRGVDTAETVGMRFEEWPETREGEHAIGLPTLHVHGLQDPGVVRHRRMMELYCKEGTTRLVKWDGGHRLPFKSSDVQLVVDGILEMARETGVL